MTENLPSFLWNQILLRTDNHTLYTCGKVCKLFAEIINNESFWIERAIFLGICDTLPNLKWRKATMNNSFEIQGDEEIDSSQFKFNYRNIVISRKGYRIVRPYIIRPDKDLEEIAEEFKLFVSENGDGIAIENNSTGCEPDDSIENCFAFSHSTSSIGVCIDLRELGIDDWVMDYVRPTIRITQKVNHRFDCASTFLLRAQLDYSKNSVRYWYEVDEAPDTNRRKSATRKWSQWEIPALWETVTIEFTDYPSGLRNLSILSCGGDTQFWAGHYGPKFSNLEVQVILPDRPALQPYQKDEENPPRESEEDRGQDNRFFALFRGLRRPLGRVVFPP